jgi:hypothetical protein
LRQPRFDHRVAAGFDVDRRVADEVGAAPVERRRAFGEFGQRPWA